MLRRSVVHDAGPVDGCETGMRNPATGSEVLPIGSMPISESARPPHNDLRGWIAVAVIAVGRITVAVVVDWIAVRVRIAISRVSGVVAIIIPGIGVGARYAQQAAGERARPESR